MQIFNKDIKLRDYICSPIGGYPCADNKINLYIYATGFCPAHCSFCPGFNSKQELDFNKLKIAITELHYKQVINRISITGGEPLVDLSNLNQILKTISDVCGHDTYHISINTNGVNLKHLRDIEYYSSLNDVHISRHHYNDIENDGIFRIKTPTLSEIKTEIEKGPAIYSLSCNLIKNYIDSPKNIQSYLDAAIDMGIYQVGFVSLMDKTLFCQDHFIDYESITPKLLATNGFAFEAIAKDCDTCKCENYTYYNNNGEVPFYFRRVIGFNMDYVKSFVYTIDNKLVTNFNKGMVLI